MFFSEKDHKYYKKNPDDIKYMSASAVAEHFSQGFDGLYWSLYKAYEFWFYRQDKNPNITLEKFLEKDPKIAKAAKNNFSRYKVGYKLKDYKLFDHLRCYGDENEVALIKDKIQDAWYNTNKEANEKGSAHHEYKEDKSHFEGEELNPWTGEMSKVIECNVWLNDNLKRRVVKLDDLKPGYYTELIVNYDFLLGQIDRLWVCEDRTFYISDWKTNKELKFENKFQKMKFVCNHLDDCNWNHYKIQLGVYCWILEKLGYTYGGSNLVHCIQDENTGKWREEIHELEYDRDLMNDIVSYLFFERMM